MFGEVGDSPVRRIDGFAIAGETVDLAAQHIDEENLVASKVLAVSSVKLNSYDGKRPVDVPKLKLAGETKKKFPIVPRGPGLVEQRRQERVRPTNGQSWNFYGHFLQQAQKDLPAAKNRGFIGQFAPE